MDGYIFIQRRGDIEAINIYKIDLFELSLTELITKYNSTEKLGFIGSHEQARYIIALHQEFLKRIMQSPISIENNILVTFNGRIKKITNNKIYYENI